MLPKRTALHLQPITDDLIPEALALNEAAVPHVNRLTHEALRRLVADSFRCQVAIVDGDVAGFLLALREGVVYDSLNYRWFSKRYERFGYVDRIIVHEDHRQCGIGKRLYEDLVASTAGHAPLIACEVNVVPPNPKSLGFHQGLGFREVGQQDTENGTKRVCLMVRDIGYH